MLENGSDPRTSQYLWEYETGKFAPGQPVIFVLPPYGATGHFECCVYGTTGISTWDLNEVNGYFEALIYGTIGFYRSL